MLTLEGQRPIPARSSRPEGRQEPTVPGLSTEIVDKPVGNPAPVLTLEGRPY